MQVYCEKNVNMPNLTDKERMKKELQNYKSILYEMLGSTNNISMIFQYEQV